MLAVESPRHWLTLVISGQSCEPGRVTEGTVGAEARSERGALRWQRGGQRRRHPRTSGAPSTRALLPRLSRLALRHQGNRQREGGQLFQSRDGNECWIRGSNPSQPRPPRFAARPSQAHASSRRTCGHRGLPPGLLGVTCESLCLRHRTRTRGQRRHG